MKEYVMIPFKVYEEKLDETKKVISELIANVRKNEPGTLLYKSMQSKEDPTTFVNFIIFADKDAHMKHRSANYVVKFVKSLYDLCPGDPHPVFLDSFDACGIAAETLEQN